MYSDVSGESQKDHAIFAAQELKNKGFFDWEVVVADERTLQLDYDQVPFGIPLPDLFEKTLSILMQAFGLTEAPVWKAYRSKGGNTHVLITLPREVPVMERVAWQAAFGSDPVREALHISSIRKKELNPILLFMHKRRDQKLLTAPTADSRRFRTEETNAEAGPALSNTSQVSS